MVNVQPVAPNDHFPTGLTSVVGRDLDVAEICALLRQGNRLLTLIGPGGIGKTRLAIEVASALRPEFADGIWYVPLAPITDPELVVPTIAQALGLRDRGARTPWEILSAHLQEKQLMLVLDNFEQLAEAAPVLARLLADCPWLTILVTSRAVLRLSIERHYIVPPLELPDPVDRVDRIAATAAVSLFESRARAAWPDFRLTVENARAVAEICQRLDGLPLAIELAAARVRHLSPDALLERLGRRLPLLSGGPRDQPERLRTMRDAIAWSYDLLDECEQRLFRCLSVFVGGFALDAAEAVVSAQPTTDGHLGNSYSALDDLASLVDKSLVSVEETQAEVGARFTMLETIREFGLEQLAASGEVESVYRAHAEWCLDLAQRTEPDLHGPKQHYWSWQLETEHDNLRAALTWLEQIGDIESSLQLATLLSSFWWFSGHLREGSSWLDRALARGEAAPALFRAQALEGAGFLAQSLADDEHAVALLERSLALYREIADDRGIAGTLYSLGVAAEDRGDYAQAEDYLKECARRSEELGVQRTKTFAHLHLGIVALGRGDLRTAVAESEAGIALAQAIDSTLGGILGAFCLALVATERGEYPRAAARFREIVHWMDESGVFGDTWPRRSGDSAGRTLAAIATLAVRCGQVGQAARLFGASEADFEAIGQSPALPERESFERATRLARAKLGHSTFQAAFAAGRVMTPAEARVVVEEVLTVASSPVQEPCPSATVILTPRERDILHLMAEGRTNREIAASLFISPYTVTGHVAHILTKLDVPNRTAAVKYAVRHGLL